MFGLRGVSAETGKILELLKLFKLHTTPLNDIQNDLINVGSGEEISISDLAHKIKKIINFNGEITFDTSKPNGNPRKLLDSELIKNLGWKPKFMLEEGLELSYSWFKKNLS